MNEICASARVLPSISIGLGIVLPVDFALCCLFHLFVCCACLFEEGTQGNANRQGATSTCSFKTAPTIANGLAHPTTGRQPFLRDVSNSRFVSTAVLAKNNSFACPNRNTTTSLRWRNNYEYRAHGRRHIHTYADTLGSSTNTTFHIKPNSFVNIFLRREKDDRFFGG